MEIRRFFVGSDAVKGDIVTLTGGELEHMTKVLRYKVGYKAYICRNDGTELLCEVESVYPDRAELKILSERKADEKHARLTLYAGILKNNKLDIVIQKAVELGLDRVVPFVSANCDESKFNRVRAEKIALEAAKQCGSVYLSEVGDPISFNELLDLVNENTLFFYENEKQNKISDSLPASRDVSLIVGSEGGFLPEEAERVISRGASSVTLGKRILRAETAGIVACALTLDALGELDYGKN